MRKAKGDRVLYNIRRMAEGDSVLSISGELQMVTVFSS